MMRTVEWSALDESARDTLLARPVPDGVNLDTVARIVDAVRADGDRALRQFTREYDGIEIEDLRVPDADIERAARRVPDTVRTVIDEAIANLTAFHEAGRTREYTLETVPGVTCARLVRPLASAGLYVPGGSAPLPSTALMLGVPSRLADVPRRVLCTPPGRDGRVDPVILYAAAACGIREIFRAGGAQAIAALACGTETIPRVDKIFGPGNAWVTAAKQRVAREPYNVAIDMPAGPSELMVVADQSADPSFVAADLLSQAEHGPDSQVFLVTDSRSLARAVTAELARQLAELPRAATARRALASGCLIIADGPNAFPVIVNRYAPEHLSLALAAPDALLDAVTNTGSVFVGHWTPESLGDYCSGTNHVLPTGGHARALSGLAVSDFEKRISVQRASRAGLVRLGPVAATLARVEGLDAHANAVDIRLPGEAGRASG